MRPTLVDLIRTGNYDTDKDQVRLAHYERWFSRLRSQRIWILELGIHTGGSLRLWRDYFSKALIAGLDCNYGFIEEDGIICFMGLQENCELLDRIHNEWAPWGWKIIIDDCSHLGEATRKSFWHLFDNHLLAGGIYVIEDWGTGYWPSWQDGEAYEPGKIHTAGMVGFIHELVDEMGMADITATKPDRGVVTPARKSKFNRMEIFHGAVIIEKAL